MRLMPNSAAKITEGTLYPLMLGTDLFVAMFAAPYISSESSDLSKIAGTLILLLWPYWLALLFLTAFISIIAAIVGSWRLRGRVALWYLCIAGASLIVLEQQKHITDPHLVVLEITLPVFVGFIGLILACALPALWLTSPMSRQARKRSPADSKGG